MIKRKIVSHKKADKRYNRQYNENDYININWVKDKLILQNCKCLYCSKELKTKNYEIFSKDISLALIE